MARIVKDAEVRREELLALALDLFMAQGYERTSVEQITRRADVAKGTFYHYFDSKQDLVEQLADSYASQLFAHLESRLAAVEGDALQRLRTFSQLATSWKMDRANESAAFGRMLYAPENLMLRHNIFSAWLERTRPLLTAILTQGVAEKTFTVEDPHATAGVVLSLWYDWGDRVAENIYRPGFDDDRAAQAAAELRAGMRAQERILGVAEGALEPNVDVEALFVQLVGASSSEGA